MKRVAKERLDNVFQLAPSGRGSDLVAANVPGRQLQHSPENGPSLRRRDGNFIDKCSIASAGQLDQACELTSLIIKMRMVLKIVLLVMRMVASRPSSESPRWHAILYACKTRRPQ